MRGPFRRSVTPVVLAGVLAASLLAGAEAGAAPRVSDLRGAARPVVAPAAPLATPSPEPFPPATPVPPSGSPSPYPTVLHTPLPSAHVPHLDAAAAILEDLDTGQVLFSLDPTDERPIASTTKIMTALLVLERTRQKDVVTVSAHAAAEEGAELGLAPGEQISVHDLLYALMLQSSNDAAVALAEHVSGTVDAFVSDMNERALTLGLSDTTFFSPNGLDDRGTSTADDLAAITREAYRSPRFARVVATRAYDIPAPDGPDRHVQNRNALLWLYPGAEGVKTGYTAAAGTCLVAVAERGNRRFLSVILGEPVEAFDDSAALLNYGFAAFRRRVLVTDGERLGETTPEVPVGEERVTVPVVAGEQLKVFVPVERADRVQRLLHLRSGVEGPVHEGDPIGSLLVRVGKLRLGRVPVVVGTVPRPRPPEPVVWWVRLLQEVGTAVTRLVHATFA